MKNIVVFVLFVLLSCVVTACVPEKTPTSDETQKPTPVVTESLTTNNAVSYVNWKLVWADEFNYTGLPNTAKWGYEVGFVRNHESQYYTKSRLQNARVENGNLIIEARKDYFAPDKPYTSASIITKNKVSWTYGRIEARAKLPYGLGTWPAIWMVGVNRYSEVDIMEFVAKLPNKIYGSIHYVLDGVNKGTGSVLTTNTSGYHIYAIEWTPEKFDFYFDNNKYYTFYIKNATNKDKSNPFWAPHYFLLNLALGSNLAGPIKDSALPQQFYVDYVRVYQKI